VGAGLFFYVNRAAKKEKGNGKKIELAGSLELQV
jgi:hypothetical protein